MAPATQQIHRPKCVLLTGRPGSGKTTLADKLSKQLYLPKISRDEFKEGYVNTFDVRHNELPEYDVPTLFVSTVDGYSPYLDEIESFIMNKG